MSAVGFAPSSTEDPELERLREVCERLNFAIRSIKEAQASLSKLNLGQTRERLNNAQWQAREAKKVLAAIGAAKTRTTTTTKQRQTR
ncbi:MAG TPA: hypothetical protein VHQ94_04120 [Pyrinomonadaceae bacterium]|jgi:uncharacterized protein (DUF1810 family)|nr:hypothetical protein [Pyrinomonadaceae bacterium]